MTIDLGESENGEESPQRELEAPDDVDALYFARGDDVAELFSNRPNFTGDVLRRADGNLIALVQHPCAMEHSTGSRLLVCQVKPVDRKLRWSGGDYKRMPLPELFRGENHAVEFDLLDLVDRAEITQLERVAILSQIGVNLLVQRWVHHNSRVVIWTKTIDAQTSGPAEETDIRADMVDELLQNGWQVDAAKAAANDWLDVQPGGKGTHRRRQMLIDPQKRAAIRKEARQFSRNAPPE